MAIDTGILEIGNDALYGDEIRKSPHNDNYSLLLANDQDLQSQLTAKLDVTIFNRHTSGIADKHNAEDIVYDGNVPSATNVESAINSNRSLINTNYATLSGRIDDADARIDNIIAQSGTSDTEVVDARYSTALDTTYPVLKDRFEAIESDLQVPDTTPFTTSASIDDLPIGSVEGKVSEFEETGLSLVNSVENGDFSDGTTGWSILNTGLSVTDGIARFLKTSGTTATGGASKVKTKNNDKIYFSIESKLISGQVYVYFSELPLSSVVLNVFTFSTIESEFSEKSIIITAPDAEYISIGRGTGTSDLFDFHADNIHAINLTNLGLETLTVSQVDDLVRSGYIDGLQSIMRPTVETVGKNLFDKDSVILGFDVSENTGEIYAFNGRFTSEFIKVKPSTSYRISGVVKRVAIYDASKNFTRGFLYGSGGATISIATDEYYIRFSQDYESLNVAQLEEGTTATAYEPYQSSKITADVALRSLPNGVADRIYESDGKLWKEKQVEEHVLQSGDITELITTPTNYDLVRTPTTLFPDRTTWFDAKEGEVLAGTFFEYSGLEPDTTAKIGGFATQQDGKLQFAVAKGTYASLAEAQADLAGTKIHYQLATPEPIDLADKGLLIEGQLDSYENGTLYNYSDTFHSPEVSFKVPSNTGAQIGSLLDSSNAQAKQIAEKANKAQEDWIEPTLLNGWVNVSGLTPARYYVDSLGTVHVEGIIQTGAANTTVFQLASGYQPDFQKAFVTASDGSLTSANKITILANGEFKVSGKAGTVVYLDGISFKAV